ncbi:hypothetical protein [Catellatospora sp. NPDC049609]|uniref:hypothetical protein n=1 Tax=Catellatospora sp. NPDC049609 TaxID=3155505 RepID=UPI00342D623E
MERPARPGTSRVEIGIEGLFGPYEAVMINDGLVEWCHAAPGFTREVVERIAADSAALRDEEPSGMVQVIEVDADGLAAAVMYDRGERLDGYTIVIEPDEDGRYWFGDVDWGWDRYRFLGMIES